MKLIKDLGMRKGTQKRPRRYGLYECEQCKDHFELMTEQVKYKKSSLCNVCAMKKRFTKHNDISSRLYKIWAQMKSRCKSKPAYSHVSVCEQWQDYMSFKEWALDNGYSETLTIDRINNAGDYEPTNCRWSTRETQNQNTRLLRSTNTTGYRGVFYDKRRDTYYANIYAFKKNNHLGSNKSKDILAKRVNEFILNNNLNQPLNEVG